VLTNRENSIKLSEVQSHASLSGLISSSVQICLAELPVMYPEHGHRLFLLTLGLWKHSHIKPSDCLQTQTKKQHNAFGKRDGTSQQGA
jgi:hypothetical protein